MLGRSLASLPYLWLHVQSLHWASFAHLPEPRAQAKDVVRAGAQAGRWHCLWKELIKNKVKVVILPRDRPGETNILRTLIQYMLYWERA